MQPQSRTLPRLAIVTSLAGLGLLWAGDAHAATFSPDHATDLARSANPDLAPCDCQDTSSTLSDPHCSLRAAVQTANLCPGPDTIDLSLVPVNNTFYLTLGSSGEDAAAQGDLDVAINEELTVVGSTHIIDGQANDRVFDVLPSTSLTLDTVNLANGWSPVGEDGGCVRVDGSDLSIIDLTIEACYTDGSGGGVYLDKGDLHVNGGVIRDCGATSRGGGLFSLDAETIIDGSEIYSNWATHGGGVSAGRVLITGATLDITATKIYSNQADDGTASSGNGGGLWANVTTTISDSEFYKNGAVMRGGGMFLDSLIDLVTIDGTDVMNNSAWAGGGVWEGITDMLINECRVYGNGAEWGGGIGSSGSAEIRYSSFFKNSADRMGGGLLCDTNDCELDIWNSTISTNFARHGGGVGVRNLGHADFNSVTFAYNEATSRGGQLVATGGTDVTLRNSIMSEGSAPLGGPECYGTLNFVDWTLVKDTLDCNFGGATNILNQSADFDAWGLHGGVTESWSLQSGSPAIDAVGGFALFDDQRHVPRSSADMGAYEF